MGGNGSRKAVYKLSSVDGSRRLIGWEGAVQSRVSVWGLGSVANQTSVENRGPIIPAPALEIRPILA